MTTSKYTVVKASEIVVEHYRGPHNWKKFKSKFLPWNYCIKCGLIALNNWISARLASKACHG